MKAVRVHSVGSPTGVPTIKALQHATGAAIVVGSFVVSAGGGEITVAGVNPTDIVGVALQAANTNPGYDAANSPATITGRKQTVTVVTPDTTTTFQASLTNNSGVAVAPTQADVLAQYGITVYNGIWTVDKFKTGANARVEVVGIDADQSVVFFKVLAAHVSTA